MDNPNPQQQLTFPLDPASVQVLVAALSPYFNASLVSQIIAGVGITISPSGGVGSVTITNAGVASLLAGAGIALSGSAGNVTVSSTITDATLPMSDIVTNNVSTSQHGFVPKLPNDATKFLNGVGAWTTPSGGGGGGGSYANGLGSVVVASGTIPTITIPHGLGVAPSRVRVTFDQAFGGPGVSHCYGVLDASGQNFQMWMFEVSISPVFINANGYIAVLVNFNVVGWRLVCTVDATNIYLTPSAYGSGSGPSNGTSWAYLWEAET